MNSPRSYEARLRLFDAQFQQKDLPRYAGWQWVVGSRGAGFQLSAFRFQRPGRRFSRIARVSRLTIPVFSASLHPCAFAAKPHPCNPCNPWLRLLRARETHETRENRKTEKVSHKGTKARRTKLKAECGNQK